MDVASLLIYIVPKEELRVRCASWKNGFSIAVGRRWSLGGSRFIEVGDRSAATDLQFRGSL
jgi:hypothetical protein